MLPQELTPLQLDLREATFVAPGLTVLPWPSLSGAALSPRASAPSPVDCTCQLDCERDHENE